MPLSQAWHFVRFRSDAGAGQTHLGLGPIGRYLSLLSPNHRLLAALLLGLAAATAMPPFNLVPMLIPSISGLVLLCGSARTKRMAFRDGFMWGMGFFVVSLYWVAISLFVDIAQYWWLLPFAVLGLPAVLSVFTGGAVLLTHLTSRPGWAGRSVIFAGWWIGGEWLRGHVLTGFP